MGRLTGFWWGLVAYLVLLGGAGAGVGLSAQEPLQPPEDPPAPTLAPTAPTIKTIELRSDTPLQLERAPESYLAFRVGQPLTEDAIRRTLRTLYASGRADRVSISRRPVPGGVAVLVSLWSNILVDEVRFEGSFAGVERRELVDTVPPQAGQPLTETRVLRGDFDLEELYARRGYLDARVTFSVTEVDERNRVVVTYRIDPGPRITVRRVGFEGDLRPVSEASLTEQLRSRPGEPYRERNARQDAERLSAWLIEQGFRTAEADLVDTQRVPDQPQIDLVYRVRVGPRVEVRVEGAERKKLEKANLLPFLGPEGYDEALLLQASDRLKAHYQRQGHYRVQVDLREERISEGAPEVLRVLVSVDPGPVYALKQVQLEGNETFEAERLTELIETSADRILGLASGRLVDEVLSADLRNLRTFYALEGFVGTRIGPPDLQIQGREIFLTIPIDEGRRRRVGAIVFEGVEELDPAVLRERLPFRQGEGFNDFLLEEGLDAVRARYDERGYVQAQVSSSLSWSEDRSRVDVTIRVFEGPQQVLGRVLVTGNRKTRTPVILRALDISPGDPVSGTRLLDLERNLYRLGLFSQVEVRFTPGDLGATRRDVVVQVTEGRTRSLIFQAGYDSDDGLRGLVGLSLGNVLGRDYTFRTDLRLATREERFRVSFEQPHLPRIPFGVRYEFFRFEEDRESYDATRRIGRIELLPLAKERKLNLALDFRDIEADDFADALTLEDPEGDGPQRVKPGILSPLEQNDDGTSRGVQVASLIPGFEWERRNDLVEPTTGWASGIQLQYTFPWFEAEASYLKLFAQHSQFFDLGGQHVLALGARLGAIEPLTTVPGAEGDPLLSVPLDERFFAGGRSTHRGFSRFALGIDGRTRVREGDDREPIGGNGLVLMNLEYRFPLFGSLGATVFYDGGNVWRDWRDVDDRLRHAVGVGARYLSPIGPLRLDVGFKLDRQPGESGFEVHFSFGNPF